MQQLAELGSGEDGERHVGGSYCKHKKERGVNE